TFALPGREVGNVRQAHLQAARTNPSGTIERGQADASAGDAIKQHIVREEAERKQRGGPAELHAHRTVIPGSSGVEEVDHMSGSKLEALDGAQPQVYRRVD